MLDATKIKQGVNFQASYAKNNLETKPHAPVSFLASQINQDTVNFQKPNNNVVAFKQRGKETCVVSFTGLKTPDVAKFSTSSTEGPLAIQMKVRGVTAHQRSTDPKMRTSDTNINDLADSKWYDGKQLELELTQDKRGQDKIVISDPEFGELGFVHPEIAEIIKEILVHNPKALRCELSNVIAGMTKGAETIGLRVNLKYDGKNPGEEQHVREAFSQVLNNEECSDKVLLYQPKTSPEEVLKEILNYEDKLYKNKPEQAAASKQKLDNTIKHIAQEIKDPANKRILLVGHCKPDGDTLGCVLGLKNAIGLMDSNKVVDCSVDDRVPGLFRHKLPGIDGEIKRPHNPERVGKIKEDLARLKAEPQNKVIQEQINILTKELAEIQNPENLLKPDAKYDLVISMDVPTPKRFTDKFKPYFDTAKKTIYIDHHPHRFNEWSEAEAGTGFKMGEIHKNGFAWISDAVPAATQLIGILGNMIVPQLKDIGDGKVKAEEVFKEPGQMDKLKAYVAALITGASTDTGSFTRTANLLPQHIKKPDGSPVLVQDRPNFLPEGMCKWLMDLTSGGIDKKWLREEISYDLTDKQNAALGSSARDMMLDSAIRGKKINEDLSLGVVEVSYDDMYGIWRAACDTPGSEDTTLLDVQNGFKYSEVMGILRADPEKTGKKGPQGGGKPGGKFGKGGKGNDEPQSLSDKAKEDYQGKYDNDRIAILVCQDKKKDQLDEKLEFAEENGLRLSLRSMEGSIHAELIASLFGGGGHGGAAGGRVDLPGVEINTPLVVKINGKVENDAAKILNTLKANYEVNHDAEMTPEEQKAKIIPMELAIASQSDQGKTTTQLIESLVTEIRKDQPEHVKKSQPNQGGQQNQGKKGKKGKNRGRVHFEGWWQKKAS